MVEVVSGVVVVVSGIVVVVAGVEVVVSGVVVVVVSGVYSTQPQNKINAIADNRGIICLLTLFTIFYTL